MEEKLNRLYRECIKELNMIGVDILNEKYYGKIDISIAKRNNKRYGCCRQEEPDKRCNNHGSEFKKYAKLRNNTYGYDISRVGDKKKDYEKSNLEYSEGQKYNYRVVCKGCDQEFYRQRINKDFTKKYVCGKCKSKFEVVKI